MRTAEVIAVGSELLGSERLDTNSLYISRRLSEIGLELRLKTVVGDDRGDLAEVFQQALHRSDLIILTGGLGPTDDDLTREVVADVLQLPLDIDEDIVGRIRARFQKRGVGMPDVNRRQAQVPRGATVLPNPNGTAPGLLIDAPDRKIVVLLPGPPREMKPMLASLCEGALANVAGGERAFSAMLFITGRTESHVEQAVQPIYSRWRAAEPPIVTTILASPGQIELHLSVRHSDADTAREILAGARHQLLGALGDDVYSTDGSTLEQTVGELLRGRGYTIAAAESCTGGLFTSRLTDVAGSSDYVRGAVVAYANEEKSGLLGVPAELIARYGAVSEPVAVAMAEGIRARAESQVAVGITGIAGPGGGTPEKPVGTVVVAVIVPQQPAFVRTHRFTGDRALVKFQSTQAALDRVRRMLIVGS
jgi:competence/damage-inducible protein CinA-like protein